MVADVKASGKENIHDQRLEISRSTINGVSRQRAAGSLQFNDVAVGAFHRFVSNSSPYIIVNFNAVVYFMFQELF